MDLLKIQAAAFMSDDQTDTGTRARAALPDRRTPIRRRTRYEGICLCSHPWEEHAIQPTYNRDQLEATGETHEARACPHLLEDGRPHCRIYVDRSDPDPAVRGAWHVSWGPWRYCRSERTAEELLWLDRPCYCRAGSFWPEHPPGFCGRCQECGAHGHASHYPGPVPYTGSWCDDHFLIELRYAKRHWGAVEAETTDARIERLRQGIAAEHEDHLAADRRTREALRERDELRHAVSAASKDEERRRSADSTDALRGGQQ